jgi:hypothetical protein
VSGTAIFFIVITTLFVIGSSVNTWLRHRHKSGVPGDAVASDRRVELLTAENAHLKSQVGRLEERIAVLERIATDPAERTAREIEQLRREAD